MRTPTGGLRPALSAHWKLDEPRGAVAIDSSGNGWHLRPPRRRRFWPAFIVAATLLLAVPAHAATRHDRFPLHVGSAGPNCATAKYLERNPRPKQNVFRQVKGTYKPRNGMGGYCNTALGKATEAYKWRLGYPRKWVKPVVGRYFVDLLRGRKHRPLAWTIVATSRLKAIQATPPTAVALRWKAILVSWLGLTESPVGSNRGRCISYSCSIGGHEVDIQASTGAYGAAWCVSTQQEAAILAGYGRFADGTASVYYAADYAHARHEDSAKVKFGSIVAFLDLDRYGHRIPGTGHMGFVVKAESKTFTYIAGNDSNGVREHTIPYGSRPYVFIRLPGVS